MTIRQLDLRILEAYQNNPDASDEDIAKLLNLKGGRRCRRSLNKLIKFGYVSLSYNVNLEMSAWKTFRIFKLNLKMSGSSARKATASIIAQHKNVLSCYFVAGPSDLIIIAEGKDKDELVKVADSILEIENVKNLTTVDIEEVLKDFRRPLAALPAPQAKANTIPTQRPRRNQKQRNSHERAEGILKGDGAAAANHTPVDATNTTQLYDRRA